MKEAEAAAAEGEEAAAAARAPAPAAVVAAAEGVAAAVTWVCSMRTTACLSSWGAWMAAAASSMSRCMRLQPRPPHKDQVDVMISLTACFPLTPQAAAASDAHPPDPRGGLRQRRRLPRCLALRCRLTLLAPLQLQRHLGVPPTHLCHQAFEALQVAAACIELLQTPTLLVNITGFDRATSPTHLDPLPRLCQLALRGVQLPPQLRDRVLQHKLEPAGDAGQPAGWDGRPWKRSSSGATTGR